MGNLRQNASFNQLSEDTIHELNVLEDIEMRTSTLCNNLRLKEDIHVSWVDLINILSPSNPNKLFGKIVDYYNRIDLCDDDVYNNIFEELWNIGKGDQEFWHCDVLWFQSIASIIHRYFKPIWWLVIDEMAEFHKQFHCFDVDELMFEAVLNLRYKGLVKDELFDCDVNGKFRLN